MITPKDIESKEFSTGFRGYNKEEVNQFLDEVMMDLQKLIEENEKLQKDVEGLKTEVAERRKSETSILKTLEQAKSLMSDISASAEKRAEVIIRNAHSDAEKIINEAKENIASVTQQTDTMKSRLNNFKVRYTKMLKDELTKMDQDEDDFGFFEDLKEDFYPASMVDDLTEPADDTLLDQLNDAEIDPEAEAAETPKTEAAPEGLSPEEVLKEMSNSTFDDKAKTIVIEHK